MNKIKILLLFVLTLVVGTVMAQQRRISGTVSDAIDVIMMANVVERDPNNRIVSATVTDMNGNFTMTIKDPKNKLQVSYIGYRLHSETIGNKSVFKIKMEDNTKEMKEVTITKQKLKNTNGLVIPEREVSVASQTFSMDEMDGLSFESVDQALQGKIAGLDIVANSGNLGSGTTMRLRGVSTINGNAEPLIVVNEQIFELPADAQKVSFEDMNNEEQISTLLQVNPEDIETIEVLKDASATAIWGAKAANGVIKIKTRRGSRGATRVDLSYRFTGSWQPQGMNMLNGDDYTMMLKEAYFNPQQNPNASAMLELDYNPSYPLIYNNYNKNTDWAKEVTQFGQSHNYYVTLTGGGEKATFRVSAGYDKSTGTIICQDLDRFSTRLALDYWVSDRIKFSSDFSLVFTDNNKNYGDVLAGAYNAMPNMSIWEYDNMGQRTGEYFTMLPLAPANGYAPGYTSKSLEDMRNNGNPIAMANLASNRDRNYTISPQFNVEYKLLGIQDDQTQLTYNGNVFLNINNISQDTYYPGRLSTNDWNSANNTYNREYKSLSFTTRHDLRLTPVFKNVDHTASIMARFEMTTGNSSDQFMGSKGVPSGVSDPTVDGFLTSAGTSTGEWRSLSFSGSAHYAYKSKYAITATLRSEGSTAYGSGNKFGTFPGISGRWNIIDESFMKPLHKWVSMLAFRPAWGITGGTVGNGYNQYNKYSDYGSYLNQGAIRPDNLRLAKLRWEKHAQWNYGFNLGLFNDMLNFAVEIYDKKTTDLVVDGVKIPGTSGFDKLAHKNVGSLRNRGWELYVNTGKFAKIGKFSMTAYANIAQNINEITSMEASVLETKNPEYDYKNETYLGRIQVGNALGSIYGFRYKGIYRYDYDHNGYTEESIKAYGDPTGDKTNTAAAAAHRGENATCPIAYDAQGNMITDAKGNPLKMVYNYGTGGAQYTFSGGDAIYEDINHDGQINALDIVYLGSALPKCNGGFGFTFFYGRWSLRTSFNYRIGNKIVNLARMQAENMTTNKNQSEAVNWRWRKNGDITEIPRAMNGTSAFNSLGNDRYVEDGSFLRFQYLQLSYSINEKKLKKYGLNSVRMSASVNNLWCWTKYTGVDPEISVGSWGVATDAAKTPRSKSFTLSLNVGF